MAAVEKRFQVFVSSTYVDLIEARQEIMQALLELDCIPAGMELFPAADDDQWTLIKKVIDDCDYYIVIVAGRYGSIGANGKSYTQMEYEYAVQSGKPVIAFLHKEPGTLASNIVEQSEEGKKKLAEFLSLAQQKMCRYWLTPSDLGSAVSRSIVKLMKTNPGIGWVRADALPSQNATDELLRLRRQIEELQSKLEAASAISGKMIENLAQGDDEANFTYTFGAYKTSPYRADTLYTSKLTTTWNYLFSVLSPHLIDEASDTVLRHALDNMLEREEPAAFVNNKEMAGHDLKNFRIGDVDFNTIKVQFLALGLMEKSSSRKPRSVSDRAAYWTLTPAGERLMMNLNAIRSPRISEPLAPPTSSQVTSAARDQSENTGGAA